jgi:hypothetical protein
MTETRLPWHGPTARREQGPLPEGGSETYVYTFVLVRPGQEEGKGETLATVELMPSEYAARGGRRSVEQQVEVERKAWARLARTKGFDGSVIVIKRRGFRRSMWAVPAGVSE